MSTRRSNIEKLPEKYRRLFGTVTDGEMGKIIGRCRNTARKMREELGIPSLQESKMFKNIDWRKYDHMFGKCPDRIIAKTISCCVRLVRKRRKELNIKPYSPEPKIRWDIFDKMLGNYTDAEIAKLVGCSRSTVWYRRNQLGVLPNYAVEFGKEMARQKKEAKVNGWNEELELIEKRRKERGKPKKG